MNQIDRELWFAKQLKRNRITQRDLARKINLDPSAISLIVSGKRALKADEALDMAQAIGVQTDELILHLAASPLSARMFS